MGLPSGTKLGPYEIQSPLGTGGMGEVYRALDTRLDRTVAVKILPSYLSENPEAKQRFDREARTISSLNHPNICTLHDVGYQDGIDYLVMEYLEGETLADRLQRGALEITQILKVSLEIVDALEKAHKRGLVHRDLKPANIFLTQDGHAKLLDFGLAKSCQAHLDGTATEDSPITVSEAQLTSTGLAVGTIAYMSPEQARGQSIDASSDLFSLGVVMYEMTTGRRPFGGSTTAVIFDAILNRQPAPVTESKPNLPPVFGRMLNRLLAKNPRDRYQSAHELMVALEEIQRATQLESSGSIRSGRKIPSIAVLPFANLSADPDNQYFSDGLSDDLTTGPAAGLAGGFQDFRLSLPWRQFGYSRNRTPVECRGAARRKCAAIGKAGACYRSIGERCGRISPLVRAL